MTEDFMDRNEIEGLSAVTCLLALFVSIVVLLDPWVDAYMRGLAVFALIFFALGSYLEAKNDQEKSHPDYAKNQKRDDGIQKGGIVLAFAACLYGVMEGSSMLNGLSSLAIALLIVTMIYGVLSKRAEKKKAKMDPLAPPAAQSSLGLIGFGIVPMTTIAFEKSAAYQHYMNDTLIFGAVLFVIGIIGGYIIHWRIQHWEEMRQQIKGFLYKLRKWQERKVFEMKEKESAMRESNKRRAADLNGWKKNNPGK